MAPAAEAAPPSPDAPAQGRDAADLDGAFCGVHAGVPASFVCSRCGTFGCAPCLFGGTDGREVCRACARGGLAEPIPWERRKELGWRKAYWETTKAVIKTPTEFYRTPSIEPGVAWPLLYGVVAKTVGMLAYAVFISVLMLIGGVAVGVAMPDEPAAGFLAAYFGCIGVGMIPMTLVQAPMQALVGILVGTSLSHVTLAIFKSGKEGFEATLRAVSYANAPFIFFGIPCIGVLLPLVWVPWIEVIGVREQHKATTDKSVLAVLGYRVMMVLALMGFYALIFGVAFSLEGTRPRP